MFQKGGQPKAALQILYNVAWASSLGGLALLAEERRRQLAFAQKLIENGRKLQGYKTYHTVAPLAEFDLDGSWDANLPNLNPEPEHYNPSNNTSSNNEWRRRKRVIRPIPTFNPPYSSPASPRPAQPTSLNKGKDDANSSALTQTAAHVPQNHGEQTHYIKHLQDIIAGHVINCLNSSNTRYRESGLRELRTYFSTAPAFASRKMQGAISLAWKIPTCEMESVLSLDIRRNMMAVLDKGREKQARGLLDKISMGSKSSHEVSMSASTSRAGQLETSQDAAAQDIAFHLSRHDYQEAFYAFVSLCDGPSQPLTEAAREAIKTLLNVFKDLSLFSVVDYIYEKTLHTLEEWRFICDDMNSLFVTKSGHNSHFGENLSDPASSCPPQRVLSNILSTATSWLIENDYHDQAEQLVREAINFEYRHLSTNHKDSITTNLFNKALKKKSFDQAKLLHKWTLASLLDDESRSSFMSKSILQAFDCMSKLEAVDFYIKCIQQYPSILRMLDDNFHANRLRLALEEYSEARLCPLPDALINLFLDRIPTEVLEISIRHGFVTQTKRVVDAMSVSDSTRAGDRLQRLVTQLQEESARLRTEISNSEVLKLDQHYDSLHAISDLLLHIASKAKSHSLAHIVEDIFNFCAESGSPSDVCLEILLASDPSKHAPKELNLLLKKFEPQHIFFSECFQLILNIIESSTGPNRKYFYSQIFLGEIPKSIVNAILESHSADILPNTVESELREGKIDTLISCLGDGSVFENMDGRTISEIYGIFAQMGPVAKTKDLLQMLPSGFLTNNFEKVVFSHTILLPRVWSVTKNFSLTNEIFQILQGSLLARSRSTTDVYNRMIMISVEAGERDAARRLVDEMRRKSCMLCDVTEWMFKIYSHTLAKEWEAVKQELSYMRHTEQWQDVRTRMMVVPCLDRIFSRYSREHSAEQTRLLFSELAEKMGAHPTRTMIKCVMEAVVRDEDVQALNSLIQTLNRNKLEGLINKDSINKLLHRITQSPYVKYSNKGEHLWGEISKEGLDSYKGVWSKLKSMQASAALEKSPKMLVRIDRGSDARKTSERKMLIASRLKAHRSAIQVYRHSLRHGLPSQQVDLELAVRASLKSSYGACDEAQAIIDEAKEAGLNTDRASRALRYHCALQKDLATEKVTGLVFEHYEELSTAGAGLHHHFAIAAAQKLLQRGDSQAALHLLHEVNQSEWCVKKPFDLPTLTLLIRAFAHAGDAQGIRWVTNTVLASDLRIDIVFTNTLKVERARFRRHCRRGSNRAVAELDVANTVPTAIIDPMTGTTVTGTGTWTGTGPVRDGNNNSSDNSLSREETMLGVIEACLEQSRQRRAEQRQNSLAFANILAKTHSSLAIGKEEVKGR